jgi:hypothetical protein
MSRRNEAVNQIVQKTGLYQSLNAYYRRSLVALLRDAYDAGHRDAELSK